MVPRQVRKGIVPATGFRIPSLGRRVCRRMTSKAIFNEVEECNGVTKVEPHYFEGPFQSMKTFSQRVRFTRVLPKIPGNQKHDPSRHKDRIQIIFFWIKTFGMTAVMLLAM